MWIKNKDEWYVYEIRGVCFVTWVSELDKANAANFPKEKISGWLSLVADIAGEDLVAVEPHT